MLKYLMKYDLKIMLKLLKWLYLLSLCLAGITRLLGIFDYLQIVRIVGIIFSALAYSAIANVIVNTFVHILMRFTSSFYKDESYLTHTLPVKKNTLLLSKYLSSLIVILLSVLVSFVSLLIMLYSPEFMQGISYALDSVVSGLNLSSGFFVFLMVVIIFSQVCCMMSIAFVAIIQGYSANSKRGLKSFLWFILYYYVCGSITSLLILAVSILSGDILSLFANVMPPKMFIAVLIVGLLSYIIYAIVFYFISRKLFNKGVNVD